MTTQVIQQNKCIQCHKTITNPSQIGGIKAIKVEGGFISGNLCQPCANKKPTQTTQQTWIQRKWALQTPTYDPPPTPTQGYPQPQTKPEKKNWPRPKMGKKEIQQLKKEFEEKKTKHPSQITWLTTWFDDRELRKAFENNYTKMRSFANSHGYGLKNLKEMIEHKKEQS